MPTPTAAFLIIGNEILSGRTQDKNLNHIATTLTARGIQLKEVAVVPDEETVIVETLNRLRARYDHVFTSGGIGPTHDDITAECIAKAFGLPFGLQPEAEAVIREYYGEEITDRRLRMARMPLTDGTDIPFALIPNPVSGAPGFRVDNVFVMAGVPRILQAMFDWVQGTLQDGPPIYSRTLSAHVPESRMADAVDSIQQAFPTLEIGSYPQMKEGKLGVSIVVRGTDEPAVEQAITQVREAFAAHTEALVEGEL